MKSFFRSLRILIPTLLIVITVALIIVSSTQAATLTAVYLSLSRLKAGLNGSAGQRVEMILAIAPSSTIPTAGTITIEYPDSEDGTWCRTAGDLVVTATASAAVDLPTSNWEIDAQLPTSGTLTASCSTGSGAGSIDKITIMNVGQLTGGTTYGVKLANGTTGVLGTNGTTGEHEITVKASSGSTLDSKSFKISLLSDDAVVITATVSAMPTINCSINDNAVSLGTLYPGGSYATTAAEVHTISTSTTGSGYYWAVYGTGDGSIDAGLYKSTPTTYLIASDGGDTLNLANPAVDGFGLTISDPDGAGTADVTSRFSDGTTGTFGTIDRAYTNAILALQQEDAQGSAEPANIIYGAKAPSDAIAGSYQETVYWVCGSYY